MRNQGFTEQQARDEQCLLKKKNAGAKNITNDLDNIWLKILN